MSGGWKFLEDALLALPELDPSVCDPALLLQHRFATLSDFMMAVSRRDLPSEVQLGLSRQAIDSVFLEHLRDDVGEDTLPVVVRACVPILENPTWGALPLVQVAGLLRVTFTPSEGCMGARPLVENPQCSDRAALAAIHSLVVHTPYLLNRFPQHAHAALEVLGSFSPRARLGVLVAYWFHHRAPATSGTVGQLARKGFGVNEFVGLVEQAEDALDSPEALEIWAGLYGDFTGSLPELHALSNLLAHAGSGGHSSTG